MILYINSNSFLSLQAEYDYSEKGVVNASRDSSYKQIKYCTGKYCNISILQPNEKMKTHH